MNSENMDLVKRQLLKKFANKKYRDAFVSSHIGTNIASQILALRIQRGWTQAELAEKTGMAQTRISVLENPDYEKFSINTLKRIASSFDVALIVKFVPFSELLNWAVDLPSSAFVIPSFEEEQKNLSISEAVTPSRQMEQPPHTMMPSYDCLGIFKELKETVPQFSQNAPRESGMPLIFGSPRVPGGIYAGVSR